jgi:hypothetical protein
MGIGYIASCVGKGLFAGVAGTAAMTLGSTIEMKLRGREASTVPSDAAGKVLGVQPRNARGKARFATVVHWTYGASWGAVRGLIAATGLRGPAADVVHFAGVWTAALVMLPSLKVAPPVTEWPPEEIALDALHHVIYAAGTGVAYELMNAQDR